MPQAHGCTQHGKGRLSDTRQHFIPSSKAHSDGQEEKIFPPGPPGPKHPWDVAGKGPGLPPGPPERKIRTVPPHCRLDSPGGQHSWGHTTQVVGDGVLQGVLLFHHEDGEALQTHQDALLVVHFEEENLDLETEEK